MARTNEGCESFCPTDLKTSSNPELITSDHQYYALSFTGTFQSVQYVDVVGPVADNRNPFVMHQQIIHSVPLKFSGNADPSVVKKQPAYNPG